MLVMHADAAWAAGSACDRTSGKRVGHPVRGYTGREMAVHPVCDHTGGKMAVHPVGDHAGGKMAVHPVCDHTGGEVTIHPARDRVGRKLPPFPAVLCHGVAAAVGAALFGLTGPQVMARSVDGPENPAQAQA